MVEDHIGMLRHIHPNIFLNGFVQGMKWFMVPSDGKSGMQSCPAHGSRFANRSVEQSLLFVADIVSRFCKQPCPEESAAASMSSQACEVPSQSAFEGYVATDIQTGTE